MRYRTRSSSDWGSRVICRRAVSNIRRSSKMPELSVILINRNEPEYLRRNYNLAHELFHVLTWQAMPPNELDAIMEKKSRIEMLADALAAALLMPRAVLEPLRRQRDQREIHRVDQHNC